MKKTISATVRLIAILATILKLFMIIFNGSGISIPIICRDQCMAKIKAKKSPQIIWEEIS